MENEEMSVERVVFKYISFGISRHFADLPSVRVSEHTWLSAEAMNVVATLRADVLSHKTVEKSCPVVFEYPSSWWQMLKDQHAPEWFKRRYPVRMKIETRTATFEEYDTYPRARISVPEAKFGVAVVKQMWK